MFASIFDIIPKIAGPFALVAFVLALIYLAARYFAPDEVAKGKVLNTFLVLAALVVISMLVFIFLKSNQAKDDNSENIEINTPEHAQHSTFYYVPANLHKFHTECEIQLESAPIKGFDGKEMTFWVENHTGKDQSGFEVEMCLFRKLKDGSQVKDFQFFRYDGLLKIGQRVSVVCTAKIKELVPDNVFDIKTNRKFIAP